MSSAPLVLGADFGTGGVRVVVVDTSDGTVVAAGSAGFPGWDAGRYCNPAGYTFRQHPRELTDAFIQAVRKAIDTLPHARRDAIAGITVDTTGSSPTPIGSDGRPVAFDPRLADDPAAMVILWKDHSAGTEGRALTEQLGREYSSEWFWAKVLRGARESEAVRREAITWAEHADWFPAMLCGIGDPAGWRRCRSGASHKALWSDHGGYPSGDLLERVDPYLTDIRESLGTEAWSPDQAFGHLSTEFAEKLGVPAGIPIGVGIFDAHSAALAGGVRPGTVAKVIGTSSSDMVVTDLPDSHDFRGVEGVGVGSILPDRVTIESGQAAYGDLTEWLVRLVTFGAPETPRKRDDIFRSLEDAAADLDPETLPVVVDWFNGRRSPYGNMNVTGAVAGLGLGTDAPGLYASLLEGAAFATRSGLEHMARLGIAIDAVHALGGVPDRSRIAVPILANVLGRPISVRVSVDASARGAAICASVVAGIYPDLITAQTVLQLPERTVVSPDPERAAIHEGRYRRYTELGSAVERLG